MATGIFINYRRDDTIATAGRLNDRLVRAFGDKHVFMDIDHIPAGVDFTQHIEAQLAQCGVLLAIIGHYWLHARDASGSRRLFDPNDLVAVEIGAALRRGTIVIPVLVDGAAMPSVDELPNQIKPLARRNAVELRNTQFGANFDRLVQKIREVLNSDSAHTRRWRMAIVAAVAFFALATLAIVFFPAAWLPRFSSTQDVESCDKSLGPIEAGLDFSGIFSGVVVDGSQSGAEVQIKLVRAGNQVKGAYLRAGICGSISGEVRGKQLHLKWNWAGSSGRGIATQAAGSLSGSSGFNEETEGGGTFILFQRKSG